MNAIALAAWVCAFGSFGWGVLRFFRKPSGLGGETLLVATLGLLFGVWQAHSLVTSTAGTARLCAAILLLVGSTLLFWWAVRACESRPLTAIFERDTPSHLVQRGPYGYVRHPFYASYTMFWFAGAVPAGSMTALLPAGIMLGVYLVAMRAEERKFVASPLAADYAAYRLATGRLIPRLPR